MRYLISAKHKKSTNETEWYSNENFESRLSVWTVWRWGSYIVEVDDISELPSEDSTGSVIISAYDKWEMESLDDAIAVYVDIDRADGISATEEFELDQLEASLEDVHNYYEYLEEGGWDCDEVVIELACPVQVELLSD
jgi:hypothetical protein